MARPQYNQFQQHMNSPSPVQTQNMSQNQRAFSPPSYQQSPTAMSPTLGGIPPAKRQRLSPNPPSPAPAAAPYHSPFSANPSPYATSPYATSPPGSQYLSLPQSPVAAQTVHSFHQPQPYQHPNNLDNRAPQGSMPPPKVPYSKVQDPDQLEKANPRDMDVNNISDVLTGSGIDLRAEEDHLLHFGSRSFNSQASGSTISPHGSFNQWSQASAHGAYQGTGQLSQSVSPEQMEAEFLRKHQQAARALNESSQQPLTDPFLFANVLRHRIAKRSYDHGINVNLDGLFDKIPTLPQNTTATVMNGSNEAVASLQADSLLNQNAPLVEILSLVSLAAEERIRTVLEESFALSQGRQNTSHGIVPPSLADIAAVSKDAQPATATPTNITKTAWEAPDSAISPMTVMVGKQPPNAARLPTPPTDVPPTPQPTVQVTNHLAKCLKRRVDDDQKYEAARVAKRQKRLQGNASTPTETPTIAPLPPPEKMTKKERDRINKLGQTEDVLHRKANETASMALGGLGGKKKYSWMTGGGGGGTSGTSTPRLNTAVGSTSGTATPSQPQQDRSLIARKRSYGAFIENTEIGENIQIRDLIHVLDHDRRERKTLVAILTRLKNTEKDEKTRVDSKQAVATPAR